MSTLQRYLKTPVLQDLKEKMVFIGGPRQVGKTTFAQSLLNHFRDGHPAYLNWDAAPDRRIIIDGSWPASEKLIVLDEIHKFVKWRGLIKGYYDKLKNTHQFLVTGSARLDYYRKGGDSLLGRYHYFHMHPFTLPEIGAEHLNELLRFGGFPEPFLKQRESVLRRWHLERRDRVVYSDLRDLERVAEISHIALLTDALPARVGSPLSRKSLAEDLEVDFKTVERWVSILENLYYCFRISPYGPPRIRAVKKEQKLYLWDWSEHEDEGKRWENLVASHLLKFCHHEQDVKGHRMELRFLRDTTGREVEFVVMKDKQPLFALECKSGEKAAAASLSYFAARTSIPVFYQVHRGTKEYSVSDRIHVLPFAKFCRKEHLV
jgi:uncharacterized protein